MVFTEGPIYGGLATSGPAEKGSKMNFAMEPRFLPLRGNDSVLDGFRYSEFHYFLGGDFDGFTRGRVPADPRFAIHPDQPAQSRHYKHAILLDLIDCRFRQLCEQSLGNVFRNLALVCQ